MKLEQIFPKEVFPLRATTTTLPGNNLRVVVKVFYQVPFAENQLKGMLIELICDLDRKNLITLAFSDNSEGAFVAKTKEGDFWEVWPGNEKDDKKLGRLLKKVAGQLDIDFDELDRLMKFNANTLLRTAQWCMAE